MKKKLNSEDRVNVLIVDDSFYSRTRSKSVELLAKIFDHVDRRYKRGFRMLTLGWSDGNTVLPLAFTLLSSEKEENRICPINPATDKRTNGYKKITRCNDGPINASDSLRYTGDLCFI